MTVTWVDKVTIGCGLAFVLIYLLRCWKCGVRPSGMATVICASSGGTLFYGAILICTPFVECLAKLPMQPMHLVIAGIALSYVGFAFVHQIWARPGSIESPHSAPPPPVSPQPRSASGGPVAAAPPASSTDAPQLPKPPQA